MNAVACSGTGTQDFWNGFVDGLVCSHGTLGATVVWLHSHGWFVVVVVLLSSSESGRLRGSQVKSTKADDGEVRDGIEGV